MIVSLLLVHSVLVLVLLFVWSLHLFRCMLPVPRSRYRACGSMIVLRYALQYVPLTKGGQACSSFAVSFVSRQCQLGIELGTLSQVLISLAFSAAWTSGDAVHRGASLYTLSVYSAEKEIWFESATIQQLTKDHPLALLCPCAVQREAAANPWGCMKCMFPWHHGALSSRVVQLSLPFHSSVCGWLCCCMTLFWIAHRDCSGTICRAVHCG